MNQTQKRLHGKVALITGASAGIGQACARVLAAEGANLVLTARRRERLDSLAAEAAGLGVEAAIVTGDAREEETARLSCAAATDRFGRLDILINNTGVGNYKNLVDTSAEEYDDMMDTNVRSTFLFTRHAVPVMISQKSGIILMISSMAGVYGFGGEAVYCMTKFAQVGFAQALDKELRPAESRSARSARAESRPSSHSATDELRRACAVEYARPGRRCRAVLLACTQSA